MAVETKTTQDACLRWSESPFLTRGQTKWFHPSPTHDEALARLLFLVEDQRRFGLLVGEAGTGKSLLLKVFLEELHPHHVTAAYVDLYGLDGREMLGELASGLNVAFASFGTPAEALRSIEDALFAIHATRQPCVVCFDHLERSGDDCPGILERLVHRERDRSSGVTFVVATRPAQVTRIARLVEEQADLRVELERLSFEETVWHVTGLLDKGGIDSPIFDLDALEAIHQRTRGIPREINRLCELALLAALSEGRDRVDANVAQSASAEIQTPPRHEAVAFAHEFT